MKTLIPQHILDLVPYQPGKPAEELMRERGLSRVVKIASNENPWGPSPKALLAIAQCSDAIHLYPDASNYALKTALAKRMNLKFENITLGAGSEGIMGCIVRCFLTPQDEVLTSEHAFIGFMVLARSVNARIKTVPMTTDMRFDVKAMAAAITPQTKLIYIANPNNPTGTMITKEEWEWFIPQVPPHALVILDEAYVEFAEHHPEYPNSQQYRFDNVITLRTFSKAHGLAGLRIGMGIGESTLITNLQKLRHPFEPNVIAQRAALAALDDQAHIDHMLVQNRRERDRLYSWLDEKKLPYIKSYTNFVLVDFQTLDRSKTFHEGLLSRGVIVRPVGAMGLPQCIRISLGTPEEMDFFFTQANEVLCEL